MKKFVVINCSVAKTKEEKLYKNGGLLIYNILKPIADSVVLVNMDLQELQLLPKFSEIAGVVISGSDKMVTDDDKDRAFLEEWIVELKKHKIPLLGICYGHQLLAKVFGGNVDYHPKGVELGSALITINNSGKSNPLFENLEENFTSYVVHAQSVLKLPQNSICLAGNSHDSNHAFCLDEHIWGVQFHPEFSYDVISKYTISESARLNLKITSDIQSTNEGAQILYNFVKIATNSTLI